MEIRASSLEDVDGIMAVYGAAKKYMAENGNPNQWNGSYPERELVLRDIGEGRSYVCRDGGRLVGTFFFAIMAEPTYARIYGGSWLRGGEYGVVHRIAVGGHRRGVASFCLDWCSSRAPDLRVDTHRDNVPMQRLLEKKLFEYRGIILLEDGDERLAYQRLAPAAFAPGA